MNKYGLFANWVVMAASLVSTATAFRLAFMKRTRWQPPEEALPYATSRFAPLLTIVVLALLHKYSTRMGVHWIAVITVLLFIVALICLFLAITTNVKFSFFYPAERKEKNRKLGGTTLTDEAAEIKRRDGHTEQEMFVDVKGNKDKIWTKDSQAWVSVRSIASFIGLIGFGTCTLAAAALLVGIRTPESRYSYWTRSKTGTDHRVAFHLFTNLAECVEDERNFEPAQFRLAGCGCKDQKPLLEDLRNEYLLGDHVAGQILELLGESLPKQGIVLEDDVTETRGDWRFWYVKDGVLSDEMFESREKCLKYQRVWSDKYEGPIVFPCAEVNERLFMIAQEKTANNEPYAPNWLRQISNSIAFKVQTVSQAEKNPDWLRPEWKNARICVSWVFDDDGARNTYLGARRSNMTKFEAILYALKHDPGAQKNVVAFGEQRTVQFLASTGK